MLSAAGDDIAPWLGFKQQYTFLQNDRPLGFPGNGAPVSQETSYCGVGNDSVFGREIAEKHAKACIQAGVLLYGINAEAMPGRWRFQIGYRGMEGEACDALTVADDIWVARYLLNRVGEQFGVQVSFDNRQVPGDWQQASMHTSFSTVYTRDPRCGLSAMKAILNALESRHDYHLAEYGVSLAGNHISERETSVNPPAKCGVVHDIDPVRIPQQIAQQGYGYLEDRRPMAGSDPYRVGVCLINAIIRDDQNGNQTYVA